MARPRSMIAGKTTVLYGLISLVKIGSIIQPRLQLDAFAKTVVIS